jgi:uncharacterized protein (TIGR00369 family)
MDLQAVYDAIPFHRDQRFTVSAGDGVVVFEGTLGEESGRSEGLDQAHGGAIAALLDTAATLAICEATGETWSTVDIRIDYLRPVRLGPVRIVARVVRAGRTVGRAAAELYVDDKLSATAVGTFVA